MWVYSPHKATHLGIIMSGGVWELGSIHLVDLYSLNSRSRLTVLQTASIANKTYCIPKFAVYNSTCLPNTLDYGFH